MKKHNRPRRFRKTRLILVVIVVSSGWLVLPPLLDALKTDPKVALDPIPHQRLTDHKGQLYMNWPEEGDLSPTKPQELPPHLADAVMAREDQRFMSHPGWDWRGFARAVKTLVTSRGRSRQGGSTITMQLVDVAYGYPEESAIGKLRSKVFEVVMASKIEKLAEKTEGSKAAGKTLILCRYLDRIPYGFNQTGIKQAAHLHFDKKVTQLGLGECAYLSGLIRAPSRNSVYFDSDNALAARDAVLTNMVKLNMITQHQADTDGRFYAKRRPVKKRRRGDGFTSSAVRRDVSALVEAGSLPLGILESPDLEIQITCDVQLQTDLQAVIRSHLSRITPGESINGAAVVLRNSDSAVLAMVGGRSFDLLEYNLANSYPGRPAGSTLKPLLYAAYLEASPTHTITTRIPNAPLSPGELPGYRGKLSPREVLARGNWPLWSGLSQSSNSMALRVASRAGYYHWSRVLRDLALAEQNPPKDTSFLLGSGNVRPLDLAAAYACLARGGRYTEPSMILRVSTGGGTIYERQPHFRTVLSQRTCTEITKGLRETLRSGTAARYGGTGLAKRFPLAGKSGTADGSTDLWFCGYGSDVTVVVWVGYPSSLRPVGAQASGGNTAFPIWNAMIETIARHGYAFRPLLGLNTGSGSPEAPRTLTRTP